MKEQAKPPTAAARPRANRRSLRRRGLPVPADGFPVVGIGASAGGLEVHRLFAALPAGNGMAFILVQHLDPTHESMMVELLAGHTPMRSGKRRTACRSSPNMSMSSRRAPISRSTTAPSDSRNRTTPWRALAVRLFPALVGEDRCPRRLRGPLGNRRRRQSGAEGGQGEGRARYRARAGRGRV